MISKEKIKDERTGRSKAFEEIKHNHKGQPSRLEEINCERCRYDRAENSLIDFIKTGSDKMKSGTLSFKSLKVMRGRFDDCMGWGIQWQ